MSGIPGALFDVQSTKKDLPLWKAVSGKVHWLDALRDRRVKPQPPRVAPTPPSNCWLRSKTNKEKVYISSPVASLHNISLKSIFDLVNTKTSPSFKNVGNVILSTKTWQGTLAILQEKNLPHLRLTFLDYPSYHPHLHHPHLHLQVAQTQSLFVNIPATTCMQLDTPRCHSELLRMQRNIVMGKWRPSSKSTDLKE